MEIFQRSVLKNTTWTLPEEKPTRKRRAFLFWRKDGRSRPDFLAVELVGNTVRYRTFPMPLTLPSESTHIDSFAVNILVGSLIVTFHFDKRCPICLLLGKIK